VVVMAGAVVATTSRSGGLGAVAIAYDRFR
jgi:hypothetical protein